jgi:hypothetical protein
MLHVLAARDESPRDLRGRDISATAPPLSTRCAWGARVGRAGRAIVTITILSSREFNQDTSRAKKAASNGPVFVTDRCKPTYVLLSIAEYQRITGDSISIADALARPDSVDIELELPPRTERACGVDLS